jgi:cell division protein FtsB
MPIGRRSASSVRSLRWPFIFAFAGALLVVLTISTGRETYRSWKINEEIRQLQTHVDALEGKRIQVLDTIQRLNSSETLDREARLRLGMKKPGERVIIVKGLETGEAAWQETLTAESTEGQTVSSADLKTTSNPQKWFYYFFSPQP